MMMQKWRTILFSSLMGSLIGVVLLVTSSAYAQCPAGITSYWTLDVDLSDSEGLNDGVGALSPAPVAGIVDGAQQFNGADTGVNVVADDSFNWAYDASFSIEYWIRRTDDAFSDPAEVVVGRDDTAITDLHWWTGLWADGKAAFVLRATNGTGTGLRATGESLEGNDDLTDGLWHHIVVVRDSGTNENRLYVDGVLNDWFAIAYDDGFGFESVVANLNMGWINSGPGYRYNGTLDEVAMYGRVLTVDEILQHFNEKVSYCAVPDDDDDDDDNGGGGGGGSDCFIGTLK